MIDARIRELGDWRGEALAHVRALVKQAVPDVVEEWKWRGVPVWEHDGILCTGETYKAVVKLTFAKGACTGRPVQATNLAFDGNVRRAIDIHEDEKIDEKALKVLIRGAVDLNKSKTQKGSGQKAQGQVAEASASCSSTRAQYVQLRRAAFAANNFYGADDIEPTSAQ